MDQKVLISIIGKKRSQKSNDAFIIAVETDLYNLPMGEVYKLIHIAMQEDRMVVIQPFKKLDLNISDLLKR